MNNLNPKETISSPSQPVYHVITVEEPTARRTITLKNSTYSLGRDPSNSIVISGKRVSRYHATLIKRADPRNNDYSFWIIDGNLDGERSTNGVFVNEEKCLVQEVKHGDVIKLGDVNITYQLVSQTTEFQKLKTDDFKYTSTEREIRQKSSSTEIDAKDLGQHLIISESNVEANAKDNHNQTTTSPKSEKNTQDIYQTLFIKSVQAIFFVESVTKKVIQANNAYCNLLGYKPEEITQLVISDFIKVNHQVFEQQLSNLVENKQVKRKGQHIRKDGSVLNVEENIVLLSSEGKKLFSFVITPVLEQTTKPQLEQNNKPSYYDSVTNLPNNSIFIDYVTTTIANAKRYNYPMAVMLLNIEYLKDTKLTLNESIKQELLKTIAELIKNCLRSGDVLGRWHEEDFAVLLPRLSNPKDAARVSQRILNLFKQPLVVNERQISINRVCIGIGAYPQDGQNAQILLSSASKVLERRKKNNIQGYEFHRVTLNNETARAIRLEHLLREAIKKKQFTVYYQPVINIKTGKITGMESLLRWNHPQMGIIGPKQFLSVAEESDLIISLDQWMLESVCGQNKNWQKMNLPSFPVSVNISSRQFQHPNFILHLTDILEKTGLETHWLCIEITEKIITDNAEIARKHIHELRKLGVHLCMDDFGIGASAVGHLQQLPFHILKLNQSFVRHLGDTSADLAIITAAIALARGFNMKLIAEGVESLQQLEILKKYECEQIQGNLFSPPIPVEEATKLLSGGNYKFSGTFFRENPDSM